MDWISTLPACDRVGSRETADPKFASSRLDSSFVAKATAGAVLTSKIKF